MRALGGVLLSSAALLVGHAIARAAVGVAISDEVETGTPRVVAERWAAAASLAVFDKHPVNRMLFPGLRVVEVRREEGSCSRPPGEVPEAERDWIGVVRVHTLVALPVGTVEVPCGGRGGADGIPAWP